MTCLLWMLPLLPLVLPAVTELPKPEDVIMVSTGFSHVVKWKPGAGTPVQASYHVSIKTERGASEEVVSGCEHVQHQLLCNLTEAFSDPTESYITMVRAMLDQQASLPAFTSRYKPVDHMALPLLTVTPCGRDLCVDLQSPHEHYREIYNILSYRLHIESSSKEDDQFFIETRSLRRETLKNLTAGRRYCVSVSFWDILEETKSNFSKPVCALTPGVHSADPGTVVLLCLLVTLVVLPAALSVSLLFLTGFISQKNTALPSVLTSIRHTEEDMSAPCRTSLSSLWNVKPCDTEESSIASGPSRPSSPGHSVQQCAAESSAQSSGSAYNQRAGSSSSSSSTTHTHFCMQQSELFISASRSHHSVDDDEENLGDEGDIQDVNLLSLRLGRFEDMENEEKPHSAGDECPASSVLLSLGEEAASEASSEAASEAGSEEASGAASGCTDDEEPDRDSGYVRRPQTDLF